MLNFIVKCDYCDGIIPVNDLMISQDGKAKFYLSPGHPVRALTEDQSGWICKECVDKEEEFYLNGNKN